MSDAAVQHYLSEFDRVGCALPGSRGAQAGERALAFARARGFPTTSQEEWKYTDTRPITKRKFRAVAPITDAAKEAASLNKTDAAEIAAARFDDLPCHELTFVNGAHAAAAEARPAPAPPIPRGATLRPLLAALREQPALLERLAPPTEDGYKHSFSALNLAFLSGGALIDIAADIELETPIHLLYFATREAPSHKRPVAVHPCNLIRLGRRARATVIETYTGAADAEYFTNSRARIQLAEGATLTHCKMQLESPRAYHIGHIDIEQRQDSAMISHSVSLGGALARNDIDAALVETGATIRLNGFYMTDGRRHVDNHTRVDHRQSRTRSDENYRGVMDGRSRAVFNGKVVVHSQAQKIIARQANANLLLSAHAEIDTKPELEIYADDVQCSHGASVGRLDEEMLFYLRSRAVDKDTATSLLTYAFADEVIKAIDIPQVRARLESIVVGKLPDSGLIRGFMA